MLTLDIPQALSFLDMLDPGGRHTLASEAPFGGASGGPKWEYGAPTQRMDGSNRRQLNRNL